MTFQPNKTIKELNIDTSRKFVVMNDGHGFFKKGDVLEWVEDYDSCPYFRRILDGRESHCSLYRLEYYRYPITWNTLEIWDEVRDKDGDSRWVLGICGRVIHLSSYCNKDYIGFLSTKEELIEYGYTIVQPEPQEETVDPEVEKAIKLLEDKGIIKEGKIIS